MHTYPLYRGQGLFHSLLAFYIKHVGKVFNFSIPNSASCSLPSLLYSLASYLLEKMIKPVKNLEKILSGRSLQNKHSKANCYLKAIYIAAHMDCHRTVTSCLKVGQTKGSEMDWGRGFRRL